MEAIARVDVDAGSLPTVGRGQGGVKSCERGSDRVRNRRVAVVVLQVWQDKVAVASQRRLESWRLK